MGTGIGDTLREAREAQGRSLEEVAVTIRARSEQLRALEEERFDGFGGDVYAKGFLRSYAQALHLDPAPLLEEYRRSYDESDPTPVPPVTATPKVQSSSRMPPAWLGWVLAMVLVVAVLAVLGTLGNSRAPQVASSPDEVAGPPPEPAETDDDADQVAADDADDADEGEPADEEPETDPEDEPEPEPDYDGVELLLALEEDSWMRVIVDGAVVFEQTVPAGQTLPYSAEQEIQVRLGNAGGVRAQLNGEDVGSLGGRGDVVELRFTPDGVDDI